MHVQNPAGSGTGVQIIDILSHDHKLALPLRVKPGEREVRRVGLLGLDRLAPHVVEAQHQIRIAGECLWRGDVLDPVLFPQPAAATEGVDPALGGYPRAGQDHDVADLLHVAHEARHQWGLQWQE